MDGQNAHLAATVLVEIALDLATAGFKPAQEALQRAALGALILQRPRQQLIDRVSGLAAQPLQQVDAAAFGTERLGEEIERRDVVGALKPGRQPRMGSGEFLRTRPRAVWIGLRVLAIAALIGRLMTKNEVLPS